MSRAAGARRAANHPELQIVVGSILISFSAVFVKLAHVGPTVSGVYRNVFGALALLVFVAVRRDPIWNGMRRLRWALIAGACFATDIFFWHRSILYVGPGLATILGNFQVFFMAAVGVLVFREGSSWRFLAAIPLAVVGLFLLVGLSWGDFGADYRRGVLYGFLTAISYALYLLSLRAARRERERVSAAANLAVVTAVTAVLLLGAARATGESLRIPDKRTLAVLLAYGVFCQAIGWIIISRTFHLVDASRAALILLLQPALTFVWDMLFFGRPTTVVEVTGAALTIGAIYMGSVRPARPAVQGTAA
ncbi:MAG TPA: DMT family transporter [Candidatus Krumholzibacteria bacterium]|nr:DMT family transporter [Candidatus Krumholzibacteria bacterium]